MARTPEDDLGGQSGTSSGNQQTIVANGQDIIALPGADFVQFADILRDGQDLILEAPDGSIIVIEGYFTAEPAPLLQAPNGETLTPQLVESFVQQHGPLQYAQQHSLNDASPVGAVQEVSGKATVTRADGSTETITLGTPIFQGDIIETEGEGAVNIVFLDESSLAVSESAKLAIDQYIFDPSSESGTTNVSVLRGLFVFTSGLIGRDDPDDVNIDTPMGSIGIRGTIIVGNITTGEVTVIEGAIVLRGFNGNEVTLAQQFETGKFNAATGDVSFLGKTTPEQFAETYGSLKTVAGSLFAGIDAGENASDSDSQQNNNTGQNSEDSGNAPAEAAPDNTGGANAAPAGEEGAATEAAPDAAGESDSGNTESNTESLQDTTFDLTATDSGFDQSAGTDSGTSSTTTTTSTTTTSNTTSVSTSSTTSGGSTTAGTSDPVTTTSPTVTGSTTTNTPPPSPTISSSSFNVAENSATGVAVGTVSAANLTNPTFSETGNGSGAGLFEIDAAGNITVQASAVLDYEATTSYTYEVQATGDDGNTVTKLLTIEIDNLNDNAPTVTGGTITINEDSQRTLTAADFGYADADGDALASVTISNITGGGMLEHYNGTSWVAVTNGQTLTASQISAGLRFTPDADDNGAGYAAFDFTASDGANTSGTSALTFNVTAINDAPTAISTTQSTSEDTPLVLTAADFGSGSFNDADGDSFTEIKITTLPGNGVLEYHDGTGWTAVSANQVITILDIDNSKLHFSPDPDENGTGYTTIGFKVGDGTDFSASEYILTMDVAAVNDAPQAVVNDITAGDGHNEGGTIVLTTSHLSATDVETTDPGQLVFRVTGLPANGVLKLGGTALAANDTFSKQDILDGLVEYVHDDSENLSDSFTFDLSDDGGSTYLTFGETLNIDVNAVDDEAPTLNGSIGDITTGLSEGGTIALGTANFDAIDADTDQEDIIFEITSAPAYGQLELASDPGNPITQFTWAQLDAGEIVYVHDDSDNFTDSFDFNIKDPAGNTDPGGPHTLNITIDPVDDNDILEGTAGDDSLDAGIGDDTVYGYDGDDTFIVADDDGNDTYHGGVGGETNGDTYDADGTVNDREYYLGANNDGSVFDVTNGTDTDNFTSLENFYAGMGDDIFFINDANAAYFINGGAGADTLDFSALTEDITYYMSSPNAVINGGATIEFSQIETFIGGSGNDAFIILDGDGNHTYDGGSGTDVYDGTAIAAASTFDIASGTIYIGGGDTDTVANIELFISGTQDDTFIAKADGLDYGFNGGGGANTLDFSQGTGSVTVDLNLLDNNQTIGGGFGAYYLEYFSNVTGSDFDDVLTGDASNNVLIGGLGNDTLRGGGGNDTLDGGAGIDTADYGAAAAGIVVDLDTGTASNDGDGGSDTLISIEDVKGSAFNDTIVGNALANTLRGMDGDDTIDGGAGDDFLYGNAGADTFMIFDGDGNDTIDGGADGSIDVYNASNVTTSMFFDLSSGSITAGGNTDTVFNIEHYIGGSTLNTFFVDDGLGYLTLDGGTGGGEYDANGWNIVYNVMAESIDLNGDVHTLINFSSIYNTGGSSVLDFSSYFEGADVSFAVEQINNNGMSFDGFSEFVGSAHNDTVIMNSFSGNIIDGGAGTDTLRFTGGGATTINPDGTTERIESFEVYDFDTNGAADNIDITLKDFMLDSNDSNLLTIEIGGSDTLNLDFSFLTGTWAYDSASAGYVQYSDGTRFVKIFDGGSGGIGNMTVTGAFTGPVGLDLNNITGADGFKIYDNINEGFGFSVAALGDVNGDGFDEIAFTKQQNGLNDGRVFILNGQAGVYASDSLANFAMTEHSGLLNIGGLSSTTDLQIAAGGDFNGDGVPDFIIGAWGANSASYSGTGNIQIVNGATGAVMVQLDGMTDFDSMGKSVSFIGDVNGDGYDDVIIGAPQADSGGTDSGAAYILFGDSYSGPVTLDINRLGMPQHESSHSLGTGGMAVEFSHTQEGNTAFVLGSNNTIRMFDMDDPASPTPVGSVIDNAFLTGSLGVANTPMTNGVADIMVEGPYMYILTGNNDNTFGQITVLNISDPSAPVLVDTFTLGNMYNATAMAMTPDGKLVVTTNNGGSHGNFIWLDVAYNGDIIGVHGTPMTTDAALTGAKDVAVLGDYAYVISTQTNSEINVVDLTGANPVLSTAIAMDGAEAIYLDPEDGMLYVVSTVGDLMIFDLIADADLLSVNWSFADAALNGATDVVVKHGTAYVTTASGVIMVDVRDPATSINLIGNIDPAVTGDDNATALAVGHDGYLYVTSGSGTDSLTTYDIEPEGFVIGGTSAGDLTGMNVVSAGDFNDDGFEDFLISMPGTDSVALVLGGEGMRNLDLSDTNTFINIDFITDVDNDIPIFYAGDMSGDGVSDIAVASDDEIHIFFGNTAITSADNLQAGSGNNDDITITAAAGFEIVGAGFAGDFNGDGFDDFAVAMHETGTDAISIYVVYGSNSPIDLDNASAGSGLNDDANAFLMTYQVPAGGANDPANFAINITSAGDVNGDGFADLLIGMPNLDTNLDSGQDGEVIIVYGRTDSGSVYYDGGGNTSISGRNDDVIMGEGGDDDILANITSQTLIGGIGNDILIDGDQLDVSLLGGAGDDILVINSDQFRKLDGGSGFDKLSLIDRPEWVLDLTNIGSEKFKNIEEIDMLDASSHTVVLGLDDIFDMMQSSPTGVAKITGDANDIFVIEMPHFGPALGILFDNNMATFNAGEGSLYEFGLSTEAGDITYESFAFNGYELWISDTLLNSGHVVIGSNIVTDNDVADQNGTINELQAGAGAQTLIGNDANNQFYDGGQNDIAMFGFEGNDVFHLMNANFDLINGGTGIDEISFDSGSFDLRSFNAHEISHVEVLTTNFSPSETLTLSMDQLLQLMESSDDSKTITINQNLASQRLAIDVAGAGDTYGNVVSGGSGNNFYDQTGATSYSTDGTYEIFSYTGGLTLKIDANFFANSDIATI